MVILSVRLIRSFEHRNIQYIAMKDVDLQQSVKEFKGKICEEIKSKAGLPPPFKTYQYDTLKISHLAHGTKANTIVIDTNEDSDPVLQDDKTLAQSGVENETEISFFKAEDYFRFQQSPEMKW